MGHPGLLEEEKPAAAARLGLQAEARDKEPIPAQVPLEEGPSMAGALVEPQQQTPEMEQGQGASRALESPWRTSPRRGQGGPHGAPWHLTEVVGEPGSS